MGNDGGSIPGRSDLVRFSDSSARAKRRANLDRDDLHYAWKFCRLSGAALRAPLVSDAFGCLYNKEAVLSALLGETSDSSNELKHIRGLRDIVDIRPGVGKTDLSDDEAGFICEATGKAMDGNTRFAYLARCGHAFATEALAMGDRSLCLICNKRYDEALDLVHLNPDRSDEKAQTRNEVRLANLASVGLSHNMTRTRTTKDTKKAKKRKFDKDDLESEEQKRPKHPSKTIYAS
ncbi:Replication termination factor 2 [Savitreella phatthalungensis]